MHLDEKVSSQLVKIGEDPPFDGISLFTLTQAWIGGGGGE